MRQDGESNDVAVTTQVVRGVEPVLEIHHILGVPRMRIRKLSKSGGRTTAPHISSMPLIAMGSGDIPAPPPFTEWTAIISGDRVDTLDVAGGVRNDRRESELRNKRF